MDTYLKLFFPLLSTLWTALEQVLSSLPPNRLLPFILHLLYSLHYSFNLLLVCFPRSQQQLSLLLGQGLRNIYSCPSKADRATAGPLTTILTLVHGFLIIRVSTSSCHTSFPRRTLSHSPFLLPSTRNRIYLPPRLTRRRSTQ